MPEPPEDTPAERPWPEEPGFPPGHWYSPNVDPAAVARRRDVLWSDRPRRTSIDFRPEAQRAFVRGPLREFHPGYGALLARSGSEPAAFTEPNDYFMGLDSRVLHAMLCAVEPTRVLEVGSGYSTRLLAAVNRHQLGSRARITSVDPFASEELRAGIRGLDEVIAEPVQDVPLDRFEKLGRDDILFVDSTHVLKTGSDVEFILCRVLPRLAAGVMVHFHDVYLPFEYPYEWVVEQRRDWNEHHAVHAVLANSDRYEVLFSCQFARWALAAEISSILGGVPAGQSLWLRVAASSQRGRRFGRGRRRAHAFPAASVAPAAEPSRHTVAYDPDLVPDPALMRTEGIEVLEEWFRWGEEWSMFLRLYGRLGPASSVMEVGCGLGRIAFALRHLVRDGSYVGFDIIKRKIQFLQRFTARYPNFRFAHADLHNTEYNPRGRLDPARFRFPYSDSSFDVVYAASVLTHLLPDRAAHYLHEMRRVLVPGGRAVISVFVLDWYAPERTRPLGFARAAFDFRHQLDDQAGVAVSNPQNPEAMIAYSMDALAGMLEAAGLRLCEAPVPGLWSGAHPAPVGAQDVLVVER